MSVSRYKMFSLMLAASSSIIPLSSAIAQSNAAAETEASEGDGGIIVTARKREESVLEVPLAIQVVGAEDIVNQGITDLRELTKLTTSVTFDRGISPNDFRVAIRGLQAEAGRTSVGILIDDIDLTSENVGNPGGGFLANPRLLDIARVEVVKGPQAALYGRSAFGGAINYISKRPSLTDMELNASFDTHTEAGFDFRFAGGVAIVPDQVGLRINGYLWDERGSYRNAISGDYVGGGKGFGIGGGLLVKPTETLSLYAVAQFSTDEFAPPPGVLQPGTTVVTLSPNQLTVLGGAPTRTIFSGEIRPGAVRLDTNLDGNDYPGVESETTRLALIGDLELGGMSLKSLTSYTRNTADFLQDNDFNGTAASAPFTGTFQLGNKNTRTKQFSQELRLQSDGSGPFSWTIGGLYWEEEVDLDELNKTVRVTGLPVTKADYDAFFRIANNDPRRKFARDTTHWSGFAFAEYAFTDALKFSVEGRYVSEKINYSLSQPNFVFFNTLARGPVPGQPVIGVLASVNVPSSTAEVKEKYFIPRAALSFQPNDDLNFYASIGTGVKPGGYATSGIVQYDQTVVYDRENLTAYELGVKANLFDRRMTINLAGFYQDYRDQQVRSQILNPTTNQIQGVTENAGKTRIWGIELETAIRPVDGLTLSANYTYLNAEFTEFLVNSNSAARVAELPDCRVVTLSNGSRLCELDRSGLTPPDLPKHRLSLRGEYEGKLSENLDFFIDASYRYNSKTFADTSNVVLQPGRSVVDGSVGIVAGPTRVALYVENLFDDRTITDSNLYQNFAIVGGSGALGYLADPRKVGARVSIKF
jgi:iron complex outermembrane recepter protein